MHSYAEPIKLRVTTEWTFKKLHDVAKRLGKRKGVLPRIPTLFSLDPDGLHELEGQPDQNVFHAVSKMHADAYILLIGKAVA